MKCSFCSKEKEIRYQLRLNSGASQWFCSKNCANKSQKKTGREGSKPRKVQSKAIIGKRICKARQADGKVCGLSIEYRRSPRGWIHSDSTDTHDHEALRSHPRRDG